MSDFSLRQPPNPDDLRRFPPAGPVCARVRGLMRDFVDGELEAGAAGTVEEHVHGCRPCGLALARAEHELMLVRRAFSPVGTDRPPAGFAVAVTQRLLREGRQLAASSEGASSEGASSEAGRAEVGAGRRRLVRAARFLVSMPGTLTLGVTLLAVMVLLQSFGGVGEDGVPQRMARLVITSSVDAHTMFNGRQLRLTSHSGLGDDQLLWVGAEGGAQGDWHDASQRSQPAATFQMEGNTALRLHHGEPVLVSGKLLVEARRPVEIAVADGSRLELGVGEYVLTVQGSDFGGRWDPAAGIPADLKVGVEVLRGDAARILRDGALPIEIGPGSIGLYSGGAVDIRGGANQQGSPILRGPDPMAPGPQIGSVRGRVWERNSVPAIGSDVLVSYRSHGLVHSATAVVGASGFFAFETGHAGEPPHCESPFAVVHVVPPAHRRELGLTAPEAYRLGSNGLHAHLQESLVVDVSFALTGTVVDDAGQPMLGVRLIPCVVDELFGCVLPWPEGQVSTHDLGHYRVERLPPRLPPNQSLVMVLMHPELEPTVVTVPVRSSPMAGAFSGRLVAPRLRSVRVQGLPVNATVQIWQDIQGLAPGSAAKLHTAQTNAEGVIESLMVGRGRLFLRNSSPSHKMLRELLPDIQQSAPIYRPAQGVSQPFAAVYETEEPLAGTSLALAGSYRHQHFQTTETEDRLEVFAVDMLTGSTLPSAQVFAVQGGGPRGRGRLRFVGFSTMAGSLRYHRQASDLGLFVISPGGGATGVEVSQALASNGLIRVASTGRVLLGNELRPTPGVSEQTVTILFEPIEAVPGNSPVFRRFAGAATGWETRGLPPGHYRATIGDQPYVVEVQPGGVAVMH